MRVYAIGDIHGQITKLREAHRRIASDREACGDSTAEVIHLGDYCDRGPDVAGVLQYFIDGLAAGEPWRMLLGNHDRLFRGFVRDGSVDDGLLFRGYTWLSPGMGGAATLASYGLNHVEELSIEQRHERFLELIPDAHVAFLNGLEPFIEYEELAFVHAGIFPGLPLSEQDEDDLVWIREDFLEDTRDHGKLIVHGHTTIPEPMNCGNRVNLDTGAGYGYELTAAVFEGRECWVLTDSGRRKLEVCSSVPAGWF